MLELVQEFARFATESAAVIKNAFWYMMSGVPITVALITGALSLGLVVGVPLSVGQVYGNVVVRRAIGLYVWIFRGVPIMIQMFLLAFGLLRDYPPFISAVLALGLTSAAYQAQIFRGSILALPEGQLKAARALGMSDLKAVKTIILPQALRLSIPAWSNEFSILLKDSAIAFVIGVTEVMARTRSVASATYKPLPLALFAGLVFFILTWIGVKALRTLEKKVRIKGYSQKGTI